MKGFEDIVVPYDPYATVPYATVLHAGSSTIAGGASLQEELGRYMTFVDTAHALLDQSRPPIPIFLVSIVPVPARWEHWGVPSTFNGMPSDSCESDPSLCFVDTSQAFLATGSPPAASLFHPDGVHLSATRGFFACMDPTTSLTPDSEFGEVGYLVLDNLDRRWVHEMTLLGNRNDDMLVLLSRLRPNAWQLFIDIALADRGMACLDAMKVSASLPVQPPEQAWRVSPSLARQALPQRAEEWYLPHEALNPLVPTGFFAA